MTELVVNTSKAGTTVKATNGDRVKMRISGDDCTAVFELLDGTYLIEATTPDGEVSQKEVAVTTQEHADLRFTDRIKNLQVGEKLKFSSGKKFIVQAKNVEGHKASSVTLVSEFIVEDVDPDGSSYGKDEAIYQALQKYIDELSALEKTFIIDRKYKSYVLSYEYTVGGPGDGWAWEDKLLDINSKFWLMSGSEIGFNTVDSGKNLNFNTDADRIKKYENGGAGRYWIRDSQAGYRVLYQYAVDVTGKRVSVEIGYTSNTQTAGMVPACDIEGDTLVSLDTDGYWVIAE